jgi:uncharacterized protein (TIGR02145 family)
MSKIYAKIIGDQVWTTENLNKSQFKLITGKQISLNDNSWVIDENPKAYVYNSIIKKHKNEYLFDINSLDLLRCYSKNWRIPTISDLNSLFQSADQNSTFQWCSSELARDLRGTYGWANNGINKIGFNAYPNPTIDIQGTRESNISRWWYYDENSNTYNGFSLYDDDIVATSGPFDNNVGLAIRLVMDLVNPRLEQNIFYV